MKYLAYINLLTKAGREVFAIIGTDSENILANSTQYGTDPYFVSGTYQLSSLW